MAAMNFLTLSFYCSFKYLRFVVIMLCVPFGQESTSSKKAKTDEDEEEGEGSDKSKSDVEDDAEQVCKIYASQ
jgi:hypothetical protein